MSGNHFVVGVDGCKSGWVAFCFELEERSYEIAYFSRFSDLVANYERAKTIAVDIPIGLSVRGWRICDLQARELLRDIRRSSVFRAPVAAALDAESWEEANQISFQTDHVGLSRQTDAIRNKIREVQQFLQSHPESTVIEVHPELCFYAMNGNAPLMDGKKRDEGKAERHRLLRDTLVEIDLRVVDRKKATIDDVLDAAAAAWTAERFATGRHEVLPRMTPGRIHF